MNYPTADDDNSPRKKWLEIDSQILNALFCVTGFGLAPWRFRDLYYLIRAKFMQDKVAMRKLAAQNKGWFRPPAWACDDGDNSSNPGLGDECRTVETTEKPALTFTGNVAPPTALWKLSFYQPSLKCSRTDSSHSHGLQEPSSGWVAASLCSRVLCRGGRGGKSRKLRDQSSRLLIKYNSTRAMYRWII